MNTEVRPMTTEHPETLSGEMFLGNFTHDDAKEIGWKTKRVGKHAYCINRTPYPYQAEHGVLPWFAKRSEIDNKPKHNE